MKNKGKCYILCTHCIYFLVFFASVGFNKWIDFHDVPLLLTLCAARVVKPAVEFLLVKRYR